MLWNNIQKVHLFIAFVGIQFCPKTSWFMIILDGWDREKPTYFILDKNKVTSHFTVEFWLARKYENGSDKVQKVGFVSNEQEYRSIRFLLFVFFLNWYFYISITQTEEFVKITLDYTFPEEFFLKQTPVWRLEREAALYIIRLFKEANHEIPESSMKVVIVNEKFNDFLFSEPVLWLRIYCILICIIQHYRLSQAHASVDVFWNIILWVTLSFLSYHVVCILFQNWLTHLNSEILREHLAFVTPTQFKLMKFQKNLNDADFKHHYVEALSFEKNSYFFYVPQLTGQQQVRAIERLELFLSMLFTLNFISLMLFDDKNQYTGNQSLLKRFQSHPLHCEGTCDDTTPKGVPIQLEEFRRRRLPIIFTESRFFDPHLAPGFLIVPHNFDVCYSLLTKGVNIKFSLHFFSSNYEYFSLQFIEMKEYLLKYLDVVIDQRTQLREELLIWNFVSDQLRYQLNLSSITYKDTKRKIALKILEELLQNLKKFEKIKHLFEGISLIIWDKAQTLTYNHYIESITDRSLIRNNQHHFRNRENAVLNSNSNPISNHFSKAKSINNHDNEFDFTHSSPHITNPRISTEQTQTNYFEFLPEYGILTVPTSTNSDQLHDFVKKYEPFFIYWNKLNPFSKKYQQELQTILRQMTTLLKCKEIRFTGSVFFSKKRQLDALKLLHSNLSFFSKLPLSDITIWISDMYHLDKEKKQLFLPYNLHLPTLREYLHLVLSSNKTLWKSLVERWRSKSCISLYKFYYKKRWCRFCSIYWKYFIVSVSYCLVWMMWKVYWLQSELLFVEFSSMFSWRFDSTIGSVSWFPFMCECVENGRIPWCCSKNVSKTFVNFRSIICSVSWVFSWWIWFMINIWCSIFETPRLDKI